MDLHPTFGTFWVSTIDLAVSEFLERHDQHDERELIESRVFHGLGSDQLFDLLHTFRRIDHSGQSTFSEVAAAEFVQGIGR